MRTSLAWHNLWHKKVRSSLAVAGVAFAVVLMFMQLGFLEAVKASATVFYNALNFDLCIRSRDYLHFVDSRTFPSERLQQARGVQGVARAAPLIVINNPWRNPIERTRRIILCLGVRPADELFRDPETASAVRELERHPMALVVDTQTRREFGPRNGRRFGPADHGVPIEINGKQVEIVGHYTSGAGMASAGVAIFKEDTLREISPQLPPGRTSLGLVKLTPGSNRQQIAFALNHQLPDDVEVLDRAQLTKEELNHWVWQTNYGLIFQTGVLLALVVGVAIVYQVLASDIDSMLPEYATLKAIGYNNRYLASVIAQQALAFALLGFVAGFVISLVLYEITSHGAQIPVRMTWTNWCLVLALSVTMCGASGLAALRRVFAANPADLF